MKAAPGRPVLTVVPPWTEPDHRHGIGWRWFQLRQAAGTVRWRILATVAATVAMVVPRVHGEAWREGFDVALGRRSASTWRQPLDSWRQGNDIAHEIVCRRRGQRWDGARFTLCCPFLVPDPPALAAVAADVAAEELEYSGAARAEADWRQRPAAAAPAGARWPTVAGALYAAGPDSAADLAGCGGRIRLALRRIGPAVAIMATAAVAADNHHVTALAPLVATRRIVVVEGRHVASPGHPGQPRPDRIRTPGRHSRPRWRRRAARWIRDAIRWRERGAHRAARWPLRAAA